MTYFKIALIRAATLAVAAPAMAKDGHMKKKNDEVVLKTTTVTCPARTTTQGDMICLNYRRLYA